MKLTYHTRWCPRMLDNVPYVGCGCIDCRAIQFWRAIRRWWILRACSGHTSRHDTSIRDEKQRHPRQGPNAVLDQTDADNYWITKENVELRAEVARLQQEWDEAEAEWMKHGAECEAQVAQLQQMLSRDEG